MATKAEFTKVYFKSVVYSNPWTKISVSCPCSVCVPDGACLFHAYLVHGLKIIHGFEISHCEFGPKSFKDPFQFMGTIFK